MHPKANIDAVLFFYKSPLIEGLGDLWELKMSIIPNDKDFFPPQLFVSQVLVTGTSVWTGDTGARKGLCCPLNCSVLGLLLRWFTIHTSQHFDI